MKKIAILIPCYNEEQTISKVIKDFKKVLPQATIYMYDNNSSDNTVARAKKAGAIVKHEYKQGKGYVIRRMFREIDAECYIVVDGDDTYPAEYAKKMADLILNKQVDMVIGDRLSSSYTSENKRLFHNFGNFLVRKSINLLFHSNIKDIMTGYRAFSYNFVKTFPILSKGFEIETEMSIHAIDKNMTTENVVISYRDRPSGSTSKLNTYSDGIKVLLTIFKLYRMYKPFCFWGTVSTCLFLLASSFMIPILNEYFTTGLVSRIPTLIVCGFTFIASIQSFFVGIILDNLIHKNKQDFEIELYKLEKNKNARNKD